MDNSEIYNFFKIVCDVVMISFIKTLFFNAKDVNGNIRKLFLLSSLVLIILNIAGIYRNSYTLWEYHDLMSYIWLGADIFQLIFCTVMYMIVFLNEKVNSFYKRIIVLFALAFLCINIYSFLVNFQWYQYEPFKIFIFWFINNLLMILFTSFIIYYICSSKLRLGFR